MEERWILQLCHGYSGPFLDVARQYAVLFRDTPYKVLTVYLTGKADERARIESASDEVVFLDYSSRAIRGLKIGAVRTVGKIAAGRNCALVIAHRFKPIYVACLGTKLPVIGVHHAFGDYDRPQRRGFARLFRKRLGLLGVSDAVRDDLRGRLPGWPPERIETLHNRLDVEAARARLASREDARAALGLPQGVPVVANVGRLHPDKDQATLIEGFAKALPRLPADTLLTIAGSGPLESGLKALAQTLGIAGRVRFLGQVPDARRYFRAFDLFVLSSDHEPFGMVLLEAMAAGVPVMATDCGGAPEIVTDPARLFPLRDAAALASKLDAFFTAAPDAGDDLARLARQFSDEAARRRFFALPMARRELSV
ncbi:MAG: glycosyltransferase [Candidatus Accumulibacter sp.]|jgi:glycosyltransferase involved in cell wall biosynthesis|nr:glycosyltransferase [Accumulibacter sp.]